MAKSFIPDYERIHCKRCGTCGVTLRTCPQCDFCVFCKKYGHVVAECPKVQPCPRCNTKGHPERKCPEINHGPGRLSRAKGWKFYGPKPGLRDEQQKTNGTSAPLKAQKRKRSDDPGSDDAQVKKKPATKSSPAKCGNKFQE